MKTQAGNDNENGAEEYCPSYEELRNAARVARWAVRMYEDIEREWPWWKRMIMEYPNKTHCRHVASRFEELADRITPNNQ